MSTTHPGTLHTLPSNPKLSLFSPTTSHPSTNNNTLLWIGGMGDTLGSVSYPFTLSSSTSWSLAICTLTSSGLGWGVKTLTSDAAEIGQIVSYIRSLRPGGKIVLMGHSTGCQDCMEYVVGKGHESRPRVDGIILQAPVSDREALSLELPAAFKNEADETALKMCRSGQSADCLPNRLTRPVFKELAITAKRWTDISVPGGADDYFSSDLSDEQLQKTFGRIPKETDLLVLYSGKDESVPGHVDKEMLVKRWLDIAGKGEGGVVAGASHNLNGDEESVVQDLVGRVVEFLERVDGGGEK